MSPILLIYLSTIQSWQIRFSYGIPKPKDVRILVVTGTVGVRPDSHLSAKPETNDWPILLKLSYWTRWWFQSFFIFTPTWRNDPIWLEFLRWVETITYSEWFIEHFAPRFCHKNSDERWISFSWELMLWRCITLLKGRSWLQVIRGRCRRCFFLMTSCHNQLLFQD